MRNQILTLTVATLVALASPSFADPDDTASVRAPRASVVAVMQDAGQALLWDGDKGEYVVVRVGDRFHEYRVTSIDTDQVVLTRRGSKEHFVLPRTSDTSDLAPKKPGANTAGHGANSSSTTSPRGERRDPARDLLDPYPPAATTLPSSEGIGDLAVLDPYGTKGPVTSVVAPSASTKTLLDPYAGIATVTAPDPSSSASAKTSRTTTSAPLDPYAGMPSLGLEPSVYPASPASPASSTGPGDPIDPYASSPSTKSSTVSSTMPAGAEPLDPYGAKPLDPYGAKPAKPVVGKVRTESHRISRTEFDNAVTDFQEVSKDVQFSIVANGVQIDNIRSGSLFHRWGFRQGDIIMDVDGKPIRGVDDAAAVYAHLMDAKKFKANIQRGADTVIMNFRFKK